MKLGKKLLILLVLMMFCIVWSSANAAEPPIQTQPGPDGMEVELLQAKISGKVLSVTFALRNPTQGRPEIEFDVADVHCIDNAESKKYHVLKDEQGAWLAGPLEKRHYRRSGENFVDYLCKASLQPVSGKKIMWFKFPAPPENATHVQVNLPDIASFMDVEVRP